MSTDRLKVNPIFEVIEALRDMGLLEVVPHLVENESPAYEPIHAFGWNGHGEQIEQYLGTAADAAGRHVVERIAFGTGGISMLDKADEEGVEMFVPVWKTQPDVQMVGVFRLVYQPQTALTADWTRRTKSNAAEWMAVYERVHQRASRKKQYGS